jgi:hypothetical protein
MVRGATSGHGLFERYCPMGQDSRTGEKGVGSVAALAAGRYDERYPIALDTECTVGTQAEGVGAAFMTSSSQRSAAARRPLVEREVLTPA